MKLPVPILFCSSFAAASLTQDRQQDACVKAAIGNYQYPNLDACKSFLLATAVPAPTTVYNVKTVQVHPVVIKRVTKTSTTLVTATKITSVVKTDVLDVTATDIDVETVQVTKVSKVTATRAANPPFKRANNQPPTIIKPTKVPAAAQDACADAAQFSSACSYMGVKPSTTTLKRQTIVSKRTTSIRLPARTVTRTVATVTKSKTAQTVLVTETYSTTIVTRVVDTVTVEDEATETIQATETVVVDPPVQTARFYTPDSQDPGVGGRVAYFSVQSTGGDDYVPNLFNVDEAQFGIHPSTGEVTVVSGPDTSAGNTLYYSTSSTWSFVFITSSAPDSSTGGKPVKCKLDATKNNKLVCQWDDNRLADFWTCRGNMILAPSGSSLGPVCGSTSYRITLYASTA
ncbi:hypothetical protein FGRA07_03573 [Fusarium graminearum]|nr:hypothetical protein FGRA07_03573 [Fusarium graminearum]